MTPSSPQSDSSPSLPLQTAAPAQVPIAASVRRPIAKSTPGGATHSGESNLTPGFLWRVFCQWWKLVVPLGILLAGIAGATVWYLHVPMYQASALVRIESQPTFIAFEKGVLNRDQDRFTETQIELIKSSVILDIVLSNSEIASMPELVKQVDPVAYIQEHLSVAQVAKSELYEVSYTSASPKDAKFVANKIVEVYLRRQADLAAGQSDFVIQALNKSTAARDARVKQLREEVLDLARKVTGKDPTGQVVMGMAAFSPATSIYSSLTEAEFTMEMLKADLQALHDVPILATDPASSAVLDMEVVNRPEIRQIEQRLFALNEALAAVRAKPRTKIGETWETDPEYQRFQEQVTQSQAELKEAKVAARKELTALRQEQRKAEQQRIIAEKSQEIASLSKKIEMLESKFKTELQELQSSGTLTAEFELKKAELERELRVQELIAQRKLALETEKNAPGSVSSEQAAKTPTAPIEPIPYKLLLMACSLSLIAPWALTVAHEAIARRIASPEQLTAESLLPVLGEIARFPRRRVAAKRGSASAVEQRELYVFAESIDSLRTNLLLTENLGAPGQRKILAVCSATSGEGKTSVAASLAMSIAEATKLPTLVIDADLRDPDIANYLEVPNQPGLAEVLSGKVPLGQALHRVGDSQTYVMPAGTLATNPHHISQSPRIDSLIVALREKFATVVIDTPPVLSASESLVFARAADLVVFCSLADVSRANQVRLAVDRLQATGANIAGAVLSGVQLNHYIYKYGSYARNV